MPVKRRASKARTHRITPEVIAAFKARDVWRLHKALGLHFAEYSPFLRSEVGGYGIPPVPEPSGERLILQTRDQAIELRRQILAAIREAEADAG